jgi:heat shock protein HtpX
MNTLKTAFLLSILTVFFVFIGGVLGGRTGVIIAFVIAVGMNFFSYWFSSSIVLKMYKAQEVSEAGNQELFNMVRTVATTAGVPMPKVYIIQSATPNAFATGRNPANGVVAVTTGIMGMLNRDELEGVIAHEMSHIKNRDILTGTIAATIAGAVMMLADMARWSAIFGGGGSDEEGGSSNIVVAIVVSLLAPMAAMLVQMAISRTREYEADADAARITKKPQALASALQKISYGVERVPMEANPATAHMFIMNPLTGRKLANLFSTHPAVEERVKKLEAMEVAGGGGVRYSGATAGGRNPIFR